MTPKKEFVKEIFKKFGDIRTFGDVGTGSILARNRVIA
jgi:hypothetical protein